MKYTQYNFRTTVFRWAWHSNWQLIFSAKGPHMCLYAFEVIMFRFILMVNQSVLGDTFCSWRIARRRVFYFAMCFSGIFYCFILWLYFHRTHWERCVTLSCVRAFSCRSPTGNNPTGRPPSFYIRNPGQRLPKMISMPASLELTTVLLTKLRVPLMHFGSSRALLGFLFELRVDNTLTFGWYHRFASIVLCICVFLS